MGGFITKRRSNETKIEQVNQLKQSDAPSPPQPVNVNVDDQVSEIVVTGRGQKDRNSNELIRDYYHRRNSSPFATSRHSNSSSARYYPPKYVNDPRHMDDAEMEAVAEELMRKEVFRNYGNKYGVDLLRNGNETAVDVPLDVSSELEQQLPGRVEGNGINTSQNSIPSSASSQSFDSFDVTGMESSPSLPSLPSLSQQPMMISTSPRLPHQQQSFQPTLPLLDEPDDGYYNPFEKAAYERPRPDPDDSVLEFRWQKGQILGSGGFGKVYLGLNIDTGELLAIKQVDLTGDAIQQKKEIDNFTKEVAVMKQLRHENIVQYLGMSTEEHNLNIFMEYVPGGSISSLLARFGSFSEQVVRVYTRQILQGLQYLHSHNIIHRDIKGANILVSNSGVIKLADFGASKQLEGLTTGTGRHSLKGTPYWMSPEVIKQNGRGRQADIWSVGCTIIEMATGSPPWSELSDPLVVLFRIASTEEPPAFPRHLSAEAHDFLRLCFIRDPKGRPNATKLLEHPFVRDSNSLSPIKSSTTIKPPDEEAINSFLRSSTNFGRSDFDIQTARR